MATVSRKGCHSVRVHREKKEALKAQRREWELAGTKIGDIMGVERKEDKDVSSASFLLFFNIFNL